ncbi:major capsid protein, partial [Neisseria sp. P0001.S006]
AEDNGLVTAAKTELASAKDGVTAIGAVVIGVAAAMVVVGLIIKAVRKGG